jgi:hypothetical protein
MKKPGDIDKKNPFRVPPLYFDDLSDRVMDKIETGPDYQAEKRSLLTIARPHFTLAAAMIILAIVSWWGLRLLIPDNDSLTGDRQPDITAYLASELDMETLISEAGGIEMTGFGEEADSEEIIDYLILNDIDYTIITEGY